ncbi:MAG: hypothetical protein Ta2D_05810 [Rickettsiales bacterium]|nr:MAG: hypothetical protein Ta2D_05810 [Rickettsiales bacterium]
MKKKISSFIVFLLLLNVCFAETIEKQEVEVLKIKDVLPQNRAGAVKILVLNKITSYSKQFSVKINETFNFERITINPLFCWKSLPTETEENKVLMTIDGKDINGEEKRFFYGWILSAQPSLSQFEHPIYDVKVIDCSRTDESKSKK